MAPHPTPTRTAYVLDAAEPIPLAVWACAQTTGYIQRARRYLPESTAHPGKMLPELARRITTEYAPPGGLVVDPMCGIGRHPGRGRHSGAPERRRGAGAPLGRANLGHARGAAYLAEMAIVYAGCFQVLRPGGLPVTVTRNLRARAACSTWLERP